MKHRTVTATIFGIALLAVASVACNGDDSTPGPTDPDATATAPAATPATPTAPAEAASSVTGTVTYLEKIALTPDAVVEVKLVDVSRADAPSVTIGEQVIKSSGQMPIESVEIVV
ncbi:MAG TPA: YbaY family lipoprotein [Dehalococcoidia bacterium]|jgi:uncharacterized lipoprotein YbaY|nr:YbaY family lipoprotein [Dehalococcoidia bacterium]